MAHKLLSAATAVGASGSLKVGQDINEHRVDVHFRSLAATKISAVIIKLQGSPSGVDAIAGVISTPTLAIGSTPERVANAAFVYRINNTNYSKGAVAAGAVFTANHVIGDGASALWGCINIYINSAGTIVTQVPLTPQIYTTAALAHVAAETIDTTSDLCYLGRILINSDATTWTANTDDMTNASDLTTATFISETSTFTDILTYTFDATDITRQKATFHVTDMGAQYIRLYLSTLTGTGEVDGYYTPIGGR